MWRILCAVVTAAALSPPEGSWSPAPEGGIDGKLVRVDVLFRHGQRVPKAPYPTDPHANATLWDDGTTQLTAEGRRQGYAFGAGLRRRYAALLPETRTWRAVKAQSSQIPRTMMTAQVVLAGMLPPKGPDRWSQDLDWQPVPVYTRAPEIDDTLIGALPCPKLKHFLNERDHPSEEQTKLRQYLQKHAGLSVHTLNSVEKLYTCMEIERQVGLELPAWTREVFPEPMRSEAGRAQARSSLTIGSARLRAGPLLKELSTTANDSVVLRLYSTHDSVLVGLLGALGLFSGVPPGFVAAAAVEYREDDGGVHVQIWWRQAAGDPFRRLHLPGCGERCPLSRFEDILRPLIPTDWARECILWTSRYNDASIDGLGWWLTLGLAFSCSVMLVIAFAYAVVRRREYEDLGEELSTKWRGFD